MSYIDYIRQEFNVDVRLAGNTYDKLLPNENTYYCGKMASAYGMHLSRMDSCAGLIITPKDLLKLSNQFPDNIVQRGSIWGTETQLTKWGDFTMVAFCNRRKDYL